MKSRTGRFRFPRARSALVFCILPLSSLVMGACAPEARTVKSKPEISPIHSLVFLREENTKRILYEDYLSAPSSTDLQIRYSEYRPIERKHGGMVTKALSRLARIARTSDDGTVEGIVNSYSDRLDKIEQGYKRMENMVEGIGIDRADFRQGLGITTAAAMTTLGTLHAFKPRAQTDEILGTKIRAGYDISRLNDPRMTLSYDDRMRVLLSREGIGGSLGTMSGLTYSGELNVRRLMATANLSFNNALSLGAVYAHRAEEVKGYVRVDF